MQTRHVVVRTRQADGQWGPNVECFISDESPENSAHVRIVARVNDDTISADAEHYFDALAQIRVTLEKIGLILQCYGASRNVYPSGMISSMGEGELAYKLTRGRPATTRDLVNIFDFGSDVDAASVAEQRAYFDEWIRSLQ